MYCLSQWKISVTWVCALSLIIWIESAYGCMCRAVKNWISTPFETFLLFSYSDYLRVFPNDSRDVKEYNHFPLWSEDSSSYLIVPKNSNNWGRQQKAEDLWDGRGSI